MEAGLHIWKQYSQFLLWLDRDSSLVATHKPTAEETT